MFAHVIWHLYLPRQLMTKLYQIDMGCIDWLPPVSGSQNIGAESMDQTITGVGCINPGSFFCIIFDILTIFVPSRGKYCINWYICIFTFMMYIHICSYLLGFIITNNSFLIILDVFQKMKETHKLAWSFPNHTLFFVCCQCGPTANWWLRLVACYSTLILPSPNGWTTALIFWGWTTNWRVSTSWPTKLLFQQVASSTFGRLPLKVSIQEKQ